MRDEHLGNAALEYARRGLPVFPVTPRGKMPLISCRDGGRGFKDATTDVEQVSQWWTRWPHANIGMPTGWPSGVYVIDLDGEDARETWTTCFPAQPIPATRAASTGRDG